MKALLQLLKKNTIKITSITKNQTLTLLRFLFPTLITPYDVKKQKKPFFLPNLHLNFKGNFVTTGLNLMNAFYE